MDQELMDELASEFKNSLKVLSAVGDETRQSLLMALLQGPQDTGMRVGEIRVLTHLSRPSVSHHLRILREAEIVSVRKEGTRNYYRLDSGSKLMVLKSLVNGLEKVLAQCESETGIL
ncbi:ArsR/SmtB family transcription factor [Paenibacillus sp. FSL K6-1217]|uniref:ArsR/SmtB family transcription factor n=1 Tax=Paenibacillus sp. FSL K6-1217 TaxID=2921466 RepID=UPI00386F219B